MIGGYTAPKGSRVGLGALLVGYYEGRELVYAGKVGTGFDDATLHRLHQRLATIEQDTSPFSRDVVRQPGVHWVRPELVAQVGFTEWTRVDKQRHRVHRAHENTPGGCQETPDASALALHRPLMAFSSCQHTYPLPAKSLRLILLLSGATAGVRRK